MRLSTSPRNPKNTLRLGEFRAVEDSGSIPFCCSCRLPPATGLSVSRSRLLCLAQPHRGEAVNPSHPAKRGNTAFPSKDDSAPKHRHRRASYRVIRYLRATHHPLQRPSRPHRFNYTHLILGIGVTIFLSVAF
jgi:hypothetical protein